MARTRIKPTAIDTSTSSVLSTWTTATRPAIPAAGHFGYNSTLGYLEWYNPTTSSWVGFFQSPSQLITYLVVAGGGGGGQGKASIDNGGGGGGGGFVLGISTVTPGTTYTVTIGAGGSGAPGANGANSSIIGTGLTSIAIGGGAGAQDAAPGNGGSGGGGASHSIYKYAGTGTTGQGYDGGTSTATSPAYGAGGGGGPLRPPKTSMAPPSNMEKRVIKKNKKMLNSQLEGGCHISKLT